MTELGQAALGYAKQGFAVFPLNGKQPLAGSHGFKDATTNPAMITQWWRAHPTANIGIATGRVSKVVVLDEDGPEGAASLAALSPLPPTRSACTGRGQHRWFIYPEGHDISRKIGIAPGLDLLGDDGYVVAPPSLHPSGRRYEWADATAPLAPFPVEWLASLQAGAGNGKRPARLTQADTLHEGERNDRLFRHGCWLREVLQLDEGEIATRLSRINAEQCDPPLDDAEVGGLAARAATYAPSAEETRDTDSGNARRLVRWHGADLRYVGDAGEWRTWDGSRWAPDVTQEAERRAWAVVRSLYQQAAAEPDANKRKPLSAHARRSDSAAHTRDMLTIASAQPELILRASAFNADPWLLSVANGVLDLRTCTRRPHLRTDLMTALAPVTYDPDATCPRWDAFLAQITNDNAALATYLQRIVGYALTGDTREQCFFLLYGTGANGKSTFLEMLRDLLGPEYAHHTPFNTLLARRDDVIRADLARMRGARFVTAIEADEGRRFDEAVVKALTGGDTITARNLYESHFEYRPQFKLFLATNYKPEIRGVDDAIWRRVRLVPFTVSIPPAEQDRALRDKLRTEASGILNWALAGCRAWQAGGLADPDLIRDATRTYKHESDLVGEFLKDCCTLGPDQHDDAPKLRREFEDWCKDEMGTTPLPGRAFNRGMTQHGLTLRKGHASRVWVGVHLNL